MTTQTLMIADSQFCDLFACITPPVTQLYIQSDNFDDLMTRPRVAIVGTRKVTAYGRDVTRRFASELARQGAVIVSGLAYGVDAIAHQAALDAGGLTMAVLPGPVEQVYPLRHSTLAQAIVRQGGALVSEYPGHQPIAFKNQFIDRNRIVSGISQALIITEAAIDSGTMHTVTFALEQGKPVFSIPGNITSPQSAGTNHIITTGAQLARSPADVMAVIGLHSGQYSLPVAHNAAEQCVLDGLAGGETDGGRLMAASRLPVSEFNRTLTMLEITGRIQAQGNNQWSLAA